MLRDGRVKENPEDRWRYCNCRYRTLKTFVDLVQYLRDPILIPDTMFFLEDFFRRPVITCIFAASTYILSKKIIIFQGTIVPYNATIL